MAPSTKQQQTEVMRYRLPALVPFVIAMAGMLIVTDLAIATGPNTTNWDRDVLGNGTTMPPHWAAVKEITGGFINLEAFQRACYHLWADRTTGSSIVTYWIAIGAWGIHVIEAIFAQLKCLRYGATPMVTILYGIGVFLSGIGQFGTLNAEAARIDKLKKKKQAQ